MSNGNTLKKVKKKKKGRIFGAQLSHQPKFLFLSYVPIKICGFTLFAEEFVTILFIFQFTDSKILENKLLKLIVHRRHLETSADFKTQSQKDFRRTSLS